MSKIKLILISILITTILPLVGFAQIDFNINDFLIEDTSPEADSEINLNSFELSWAADTYTPYEYLGRALPSKGSVVTVEAIINISGGSPTSLKYSWFLDEIFQESKSGYGRDSFQFRVRRNEGNSHTILVKVFNESRSFLVEKSIEIPIVAPEIVVYSSNGNYGFSDQASKIFLILSGKKFSFIAKPYFFSIKKLTDLTFEWRFPGQESIISSTYDANVLDLTISGKEDGEILEKNIWIKANNKTNSIQEASQTIRVRIY